MTNKNAGDRSAKGSRLARTRLLAMFPTEVGSLNKEGLARLAFKPDGMAAEVISALKKHGVEAGESRKKVAEQVKVKFPKSSDATIKTQMYRGIVYVRGGRNQEPTR